MKPSVNLPCYERKWFNRNYSPHSLKAKSVSGGINTVGAQVISSLSNIAATMLMARLILPQDFGLVAMVTSFTGFALLLKDLGLAQAIIQKEKISQEEISKVFWINFLLSTILGIIILTLGPVLQRFYHEPKLASITFSYALMAVVAGLSVQHAALMNRQMQFKRLALITVLATIAGQFTGVILAYRGLGYWAIVAISLVNTCMQTVLLWIFCDWRPSFIKPDLSVSSYLKFGAGVTGFNMINYFSRNLDNILIGKYIGAQPLGLYSKAYQLLMLPINQLRDPLNAVGTPALSTLFRDPEKYLRYYKEFLFMLSFFSVPIVAFLFICSGPIILLVLGPNWAGAAGIFQLLAITAIIQPIASTRGMVLITSGQSGRYFKWGVWNAIIVIIAFFIGLTYGINGIAISYAVANYLLLIPSLQFCYKNTPVTVMDFFDTVTPSFLFSITAALLTHFSLRWIPSTNNLLIILFAFLLFSITYLALWWISPKTRTKVKQVVQLFKKMVLKN